MKALSNALSVTRFLIIVALAMTASMTWSSELMAQSSQADPADAGAGGYGGVNPSGGGAGNCSPATCSPQTPRSNFCDLSTWATTSANTASANWACAADALRSIAGLLTGGGSLAVEIAALLVNLMSSLFTYLDPIFLPSERPPSMRHYFTAAARFFEAGNGPPGNLTYPCLGAVANSLRSVWSASDSMADLNSRPISSTDIDTLGLSVQTLTRIVSAMAAVASLAAQCTTALASSGLGDKLAAMGIIMEKAGKIARVGTAWMSLVRCGVAIGQGAYVIGANGYCMFSDLINVWNQGRNLANARRAYLLSPMAPSSCPISDDAARSAAMRRYGMMLGFESVTKNWLGNPSPDKCGRMCSDTDATAADEAFCNSHLGLVFAPGDSALCASVCTDNMGRSGRDLCVSYCCLQDASCVNSANVLHPQIEQPDPGPCADECTVGATSCGHLVNPTYSYGEDLYGDLTPVRCNPRPTATACNWWGRNGAQCGFPEVCSGGVCR